MSDSNDQSPATPLDDSLRPHSFAGIQEYDKRLPRWWLLTLYGAMVFAATYWAYYHVYVSACVHRLLSAWRWRKTRSAPHGTPAC